MNDYQLEQLKVLHRGEPYGSPAQQEISCINMINSILAYNWVKKDKTAVELLTWELHERPHSYLQDYVAKLGYEKVVTLIDNQMKDVDIISTDVFKDNEGLRYNAIIWKD